MPDKVILQFFMIALLDLDRPMNEIRSDSAIVAIDFLLEIISDRPVSIISAFEAS